jgi:hypothetical protein
VRGTGSAPRTRLGRSDPHDHDGSRPLFLFDEVLPVNTYDPADLTVYVHLAGPAHDRSSRVGGGTTGTPLPAQYANQSPRTRLPRRPARSGSRQAGAAPSGA